MAKINRNDLCPCGSGLKYKNCCGSSKNNTITQEKSSRSLVDFVKLRISEDVVRLTDAMQLILGPYGYEFCNAHGLKLREEYEKDCFREYVKMDPLGVYMSIDGREDDLIKLRPYGGNLPEKNMDIPSLIEKGLIGSDNLQVELFHAYVLNHLEKCFGDYLYIPKPGLLFNQNFGAFAYRGYDYIFAIAIYLELQLGVHIYLAEHPKPENANVPKCSKMLAAEDMQEKMRPVFDAVSPFVEDYLRVAEAVSKIHDPKKDLERYYKEGVITQEEYKSRREMLNGALFNGSLQRYSYGDYLYNLVYATVFNIGELYAIARFSFPQCDFVKYVSGIERVSELFEGNLESVEITGEEIKEYCGVSDDTKVNAEDISISRKALYHSAVFDLMDELNGLSNSSLPAEFEYIDDGEVNEDEYTKRKLNPARKSTRTASLKKLQMELYETLNGKSITFCLSDEPGDLSNMKVRGKYMLLPWLSNGKEHTVHCRPFDKKPKDPELLISPNIEDRQEYLTMEYRLTCIPVNCISEYLNPEFFYNWDERNELYKKVEKQNRQLTEINETLKRHIALNEELVRNLSHSAANYLNAEKLTKTGLELNNAKPDNPTLEQLHLEGLNLMLQSEQERYLTRQLNSLVWRCSADVSALTKQIRGGLSKSEGDGIHVPFDFAIKTVLARVLFREGDKRSEFILKKKFGKTDSEITLLKSSFMLDVLAYCGESDTPAADWYNSHLGRLSLEISPTWEKLKIKEGLAFYDLVVEIVTEQFLNALSHADVDTEEVQMNFMQAEEFRGRPRWLCICCTTLAGYDYEGGRGVGIKSLDSMLRLLNSGKRGITAEMEMGIFSNEAWLLASLARPL